MPIASSHALLLLIVVLLTIGCAPKQSAVRADLRATDTAGRVPALFDAADQQDPQTLAELVHALMDEDPAVRLFAIQALQERTGQTLGYHYYDPAEPRRAATQRWHLWLDQQSGQSSPATAEVDTQP